MGLEHLRNVFGSYSKALEIALVKRGIKPVVRQGFYDNEIGKVKDYCRANGLAYETAPYKVVIADPNKRFSNKGFKARVDDPRRGMYFIYISRDENKAATARVLEMKDDKRRLGLLLGYPECCVEFFIENFRERSKLDNNYTVPALKNSQGNRFPFFNNIFKRHKDAVLISHFPHSFDCEASKNIAKRNLRLLDDLDPAIATKFIFELKGKIRIGNREIEFY